MTNNPSGNTDEIRCQYCGSNETDIAINEEGSKYQVWHSNPYKNCTWICGECYRYYLYLERSSSSIFRSKIRKELT